LLDVTGPKALGRCHELLNTDNIYNNYKIVYVLHHIYGYKDLRNSIQNSDGIDCIQTKFPNYYDLKKILIIVNCGIVTSIYRRLIGYVCKYNR
jgi:hypothetical protein